MHQSDLENQCGFMLQTLSSNHVTIIKGGWIIGYTQPYQDHLIPALNTYFMDIHQSKISI